MGIAMSEDLKKICLKSNLAGTLDLGWEKKNGKVHLDLTWNVLNWG